MPTRVMGRGAEADLAGDGPLPIFEPARVVSHGVDVSVGQGGGLEIDERWLERGEVKLPGRVVADHVDLDPDARLHLQEGEIVRQVLGPAQ